MPRALTREEFLEILETLAHVQLRALRLARGGPRGHPKGPPRAQSNIDIVIDILDSPVFRLCGKS